MRLTFRPVLKRNQGEMLGAAAPRSTMSHPAMPEADPLAEAEPAAPTGANTAAAARLRRETVAIFADAGPVGARQFPVKV
ncbi:hypothetical protein DMP23_43490 [Amycolatopsis sp. A1MSW2902]